MQYRVVKETTKGAKDRAYSSSKLLPMSFCSNCSFCRYHNRSNLFEMQHEVKFSQRCFQGPFRQMPGENFIWAKTASFQNLSNIAFSYHSYMYDMETAQETALNKTHVICKNINISVILKAFMGYF